MSEPTNTLDLTRDIELHEELEISGDPDKLLNDHADDEEAFESSAWILATEHRTLYRTLQLLVAGGIVTREKVLEAYALAEKLR